MLRVYLKYTPANDAVIQDLKRVSRPGAGSTWGATRFRRVQGGLGIAFSPRRKA